jgi:hypothetical protein
MLDSLTRQALAQFPDQIAACFQLVPASHHAWSPASWEGVPSERFTAIGQICHVRDIEIDGYHVRFRRVRTETRPDLAPIDGDDLAIRRNYAAANPAEVLAAFRQARAETLDLLDAVRPEEWNRNATFAEYGELTLQSLVHYLCSHDQQHLAGLQWLLGRIHAPDRGGSQ